MFWSELFTAWAHHIETALYPCFVSDLRSTDLLLFRGVMYHCFWSGFSIWSEFSSVWNIDLLLHLVESLYYCLLNQRTAVIHLEGFNITVWDLSFVSYRLEFTIVLNQHCKIYIKIWDLLLHSIDLVIYAVYASDLKCFCFDNLKSDCCPKI
jgi:hypothetical protein